MTARTRAEIVLKLFENESNEVMTGTVRELMRSMNLPNIEKMTETQFNLFILAIIDKNKEKKSE